MEELIAEIVADLAIELEEENTAILEIKVRNAIRTVRQARNYQSNHTEEFIEKDILQFRNNIHDLAIYDYNQIGAEGQSAHNENGISRTWKSRSECLTGIYPYAAFL